MAPFSTYANTFTILLADIANSYVWKTNTGVEVVVFPTAYVRIVALKLFNEIIAKGAYN